MSASNARTATSRQSLHDAAAGAPALRIAYQGEPGAFGEAAARGFVGARAERVELAPLPSFAAVFAAVSGGAARYGVAPIENSQAGGVHEVYDLLRETPLRVVAERCLPVRHCLLALPGQTLGDIRRVLSHPQALAQCDAYLGALGVERVAESNTAASARLIRERGLAGFAAIASERAAELYALDILARDIQARQDNATRFLALERAADGDASAPPLEASRAGEHGWRTMLLLELPQRAGALHQALGYFARREINLLRLEARPARERPWESVFFLDIEGRPQDAPVARALAALAKRATRLRVLGAFPRAAGC